MLLLLLLLLLLMMMLLSLMLLILLQVDDVPEKRMATDVKSSYMGLQYANKVLLVPSHPF